MKKILLVGKLNEITKQISDCLSPFFQVQLTSENVEVVSGMMKVAKPDLVIVSLVGLYDVGGGIFFLFSDSYPHIPVITIGTERECSTYLKYYEEEQFENLIRPVNNEQIYQLCMARLHMDEKEIPREKPKQHILVVDDNPVILRTVKKMLDTQYSVAVAASGVQAMTSIGKKRPDLILLDYEMPVCDGRQTLEMIRADEELKDIPVIFLTGVSDRAHIEAVLSLKPAGYYLKPVKEEKLLESIAGVLK